MAVEGPQPFKWTYVAASDLRTKQYYFVKMVTGGDGDQCDVCSGVTDIPIGILQNKPNTGEEAEVVRIGMSKVSSDAALTRGVEIGTSADGQAAVYAAGTDTTKRIVGDVELGSGGVGVLATVSIMCVGAARGA